MPLVHSPPFLYISVMWVHLEYGCVSTCGGECLKTEELNSQVCLIIALWSTASSSVVLSLGLNYSTLKYKWGDTLNYSIMQRTRRGENANPQILLYVSQMKIDLCPTLILYNLIMVLLLFCSKTAALRGDPVLRESDWPKLPIQVFMLKGEL